MTRSQWIRCEGTSHKTKQWASGIIRRASDGLDNRTAGAKAHDRVPMVVSMKKAAFTAIAADDDADGGADYNVGDEVNLCCVL